jgi:uncharacterized delta-60 repeat protein
VVASCLIGIATLVPSQAGARFGRLDRGFGTNGVAVAALNFGLPRFFYAVDVHAALGPNGRIVVSGGQTLLAFRANGRIDRSFGPEGLLHLELVEGAPFFTLADLAVDRQGRIVVAGSAGSPRKAAILRFLPAGRPDPTFGGGDGALLTDFGIQPSGSTPAVSMGVTGVAVDERGQIVVAGSAVREATGACVFESGFVGRLTAAGSVDPTFGASGAVLYDHSSINSVEGLALDAAGAPLFFGRATACRGGLEYDPTRVTRLEPSGGPDPGFGRSGQAEIEPAALALAPDGSGRTVVLLGKALLRLTVSGRLDRSFGDRGLAVLPLSGARSKAQALAITPNDGIVVTGTQVHDSRATGALITQRRSILARLGPRGAVDRRLGIVKTRLGRGSNAVGRQVLLEEDGDAIVAGMARSPRLATDEGLVLFGFDLTR